MVKFLLDPGYNVYGTDTSESEIQIDNAQNPGRFFLQDLSKNDLPKLDVVEFKGAGRLPYLWKSMVIKSTLKSG